MAILSGTALNKENGSPVCKAKVELFLDGDYVNEKYTDDYGDYSFSDLNEDDYRIKITKCCYSPFCSCNMLTISEGENIYNFSLDPDYVCKIKCEIMAAESELTEEKQRVYTMISDYLSSITFSQQNIWRYTNLLCMLDDGTSELDCCISNVLDQLTICKECECDG